MAVLSVVWVWNERGHDREVDTITGFGAEELPGVLLMVVLADDLQLAATACEGGDVDADDVAGLRLARLAEQSADEAHH
jgi:hypothetical protein